MADQKPTTKPAPKITRNTPHPHKPMKPKLAKHALRAGVFLLALAVGPANAQVTPGGGCGTAANPCYTQGSGGGGTPLPTIPPKLTAYGILPVTASSVALSTITVSPNSAAWSTTYPSGYVAIRNSILSAGVVYVCWLGGTCSATVGDPVAVGQSATRNVGNGVSPTLFAASTATVTGAE